MLKQNLLAELKFFMPKKARKFKKHLLGSLIFSQLKEIEVTRCLKLKKLPLDPSRAMGGKIVIKGKEDRQDELQLY